ncbi:MAG: DNA polymerase IV [Oscillospiraceae bacterium]|nr:DNA polymerase IV [Oscillospiraceae bacterium]
MSVILHSDLNCFYASVEMNEAPHLKDQMVAVCGSTENRHGIVLTASYPAKRHGVKTGMANWQAKQACPGLIMVPPHYDMYLKYSRIVRRIYRRYSETIEPFGMDENWIDLPFTSDVSGEGYKIADEIRKTVQKETGLTVSVGVSFSKIFAKLGSDMKKPNAVTAISKADYREKVWPLPVSDLLYVGPATTRKLAMLGIMTIGDLANTDPWIIHNKLGKNGLMLHQFANGTDGARVMPAHYEPPVKSVGHGSTCIRDLESNYEVWLVLLELAQDVGHRLRVHEIQACAVQISVRDNELGWQQWQAPLSYPSQSPYEIACAGYELFRTSYDWEKPIRALTIRGINPRSASAPIQLDMFNDYVPHQKRKALDDAIDGIRNRYGPRAIFNASLKDELGLAKDKCETVPMPSPMYQ